MPEFQTIETFVKCDAHTLASVIEKYRYVLDQLHCLSSDVDIWLSSIVWPSWEEGYPTDYPSFTLFGENKLFPARIYLSFPIAEDEESWSGWVELGLLLEVESLRAVEPGGLYYERVGSFLWHLLTTFAMTFPENGVYCTDEMQNGHVGYALMTGGGNFWLASGYEPAYPLFDAALVPLHIAGRFMLVPEMFERVTWNSFVGLAVKDRFVSLPWISHSADFYQSLSDEERSKSLQELEGQDWGEGDYFPSYLVRTTHALRRKPLRDFTIEDLRIMIGQNIGLDYLVPLAIEQLQRNPLAAGDFYEGDLLGNVLTVRPDFWQQRPDLRRAIEEIIATMPAFPEILRKELSIFQQN